MQRFGYLALIAGLLAGCAGSDPSRSVPPFGGSDGGSSGSGSGSGSDPSCPTSIVAAPTTAVCAAATKTCLDACMDETCEDNCYAMDPMMDACAECTDDAFTACVNAAGCQAAYDALQCCVATCADPDSDACYTMTCATQSSAFDTCSDANGEACTVDVCFKPT